VRRALLAVVAALLLAGCGGGDEAATTETTTTTTTTASGETTKLSVYWLLEGKVWPTLREVDQTEAVATVALEELLAGPTAEEDVQFSFSSAIPKGVELESVTVEDCERVTRQLQYVLEVEAVAYERLEVSSPGLDRPLKRPADYERFAGHEVNVTLKVAFKGRKNYRGLLMAAGEGWRLALTGDKAEQALDFQLDEVSEARLVPVLDFKGRARRMPGAQPAAAQLHGADGGQTR